MALVFLLQGCRTETINEENNQYNHEVTKALYDMQKVPQFSSFISRAKSKKENSKNSLNVLNDKSKVLVITKPNITSYSTLVRNADSGFEILVYSVDKNGKEFFYKAKYIPENKTVNNKIENFTGKVEFSNETDELLQTVRYSNGVVVNTNEKTGINSKSSPCHYYVTITAVRCTAGDGHAPGEACSGTADQQPYYDVYVSQYCNQEQDAGGFTTGSGSYGGTGEYGSYGGGFNALELIMNNTDTYHWNLFNQLSADNRTKIVELITYNAIDGSMYNFMISFFNQNPTTTAEQFLNWFVGQNEGQDFFYDENYWEDPNLSFPAQALPSWNAFYAAYPHESSAQLYGVVGGAVAQAQIDYPAQTVNGCALKVSRALNYSGVIIPNIPGKTLKGADGKYYFLNAKALNAWMRKTFGVSPNNPKHINLTKLDGGSNGKNFPNLIKNKKGIFSMVSPQNSTWASGHADILYPNGTCKANCHFFDGDILYIDIWILN